MAGAGYAAGMNGSGLQRDGAEGGVGRGATFAMAAVLTLGVARAVLGIEMLPGWTGDPSMLPVPTTSLTPAWVLGVNAATIAAAAVVMMLVWVPRTRGVLEGLALMLASAGVAWHGLRGGVEVDQLVVGTSWLAAGWTGVACARAAMVPMLRRMVVAFVAGLVVMIAAKGAVQVLVEHPAMVASFERNKAAVLETNGWSAGSAMARAYEHRLRQSEATGWFGLANIAATIGAGGAVLGLGLVVAWWRSEQRAAVYGLGAATLLVGGAGLVVMAGSKGGVAAAGIGAMVALAGLMAARGTVGSEGGLNGVLARWWAWLPMGAAVLVMAGLAARGVMGERLGERSLLFRWFYVEAAARIAAGRPITGVGAAGFKEAYLTAKNPLSPEEVSSPHCWPLDLVAGLGVLGAGMVVLFGWWVWRLGGAVGRDESSAVAAVDVREEIRPIFVGLSLATAMGLWFEMAVGTPEGGATRLAGLAGGLVAAAAVLRLCPAWWWLAGAGTAVACLSLIDLAPSGVGSGAMTLAMVAGMVAGGSSAVRGAGLVLAGRMAGVIVSGVAGVAGVGGVAVSVVALPRVWSWEQRMLRAAEVVMEPARLRQELTLIWGDRAMGLTAGERAEIGERLRRVAGVGIDEPRDAIMRAVEAARLKSLEVAAAGLAAAAGEMPSHAGTREAASRVRLQRARGMWEVDRAGAEREIEGALTASEVRAGDPVSAWAWRATVLESVGRIRGEAGTVWGPGAVAAMERAASADPWSAVHPVRLAELCVEAGDPVGAARWAERALEADERMRLDPSGTRRLTLEQRARMKGLSGG